LVWDQGGITRKELATLFSVPYTTARSWVQKWSKNVPVEV
jgi:transposase